MNRLWGATRTASREKTEDAADVLTDDPSTGTEREPAVSPEDKIEDDSQAKPHLETQPESLSATDTERTESDTAEGELDDQDDGPEAAGAASGRTSRAVGWRRSALVALAVVLLAAGVAFLYEAHQTRSTPSAENHALTDTEATNRVAGDVDNALARIFSYTPKGTDATEKSARSVLTGRAARQYGELFDRVRSDLAEQKVSLTTVAVRTGVVELHDGTAKLLVFLDQTSRRDAKETYAAAQLSVTARFENDRWRIADIQTR
ncbi:MULTISPECIES: hypothetical protein [unclassified Streptomyces]|uniref:hypothetical protein n=1 Tax=unclassified Streptomyces TaxID=2593676 RepID=UPI002251C535|nr:hypothetical protein [Streptomyces sp. NBC_00340]MCX5134135.1 hypothetical protein [Streptomyces sp. NBC_00340]